MAKFSSRDGIAVMSCSKGLEKIADDLISGVLGKVIKVDVGVEPQMGKVGDPALPSDPELGVAGGRTVRLFDVLVGLREEIHEVM